MMDRPRDEVLVLSAFMIVAAILNRRPTTDQVKCYLEVTLETLDMDIDDRTIESLVPHLEDEALLGRLSDLRLLAPGNRHGDESFLILADTVNENRNYRPHRVTMMGRNLCDVEVNLGVFTTEEDGTADEESECEQEEKADYE